MLAGVLLALLLPVAACMSALEPAPAKVSVDYSYSGQEVEIAPDGSLEVTLECDPNLGFEWELNTISDQTVLKLVNQNFRLPQPEDGPDCQGKEIWSFKTINKGEAIIAMDYLQPWQRRFGPQDRFNLTVSVR